MRGASQTALMVAAYRGRASLQPGAICSDPWAARLAGDEGRKVAERYDHRNPHMELWVAVRTAFFDTWVHRGISNGIPQVVLLGAGLDTRAARLAAVGVSFFEVDHPQTQEMKLAGLAKLEGYPISSARYVSCNFEEEDLLAQLTASGFALDAPALFLWEGVTPYLSELAVRSTLHRIAHQTHPQTQVGFDHLLTKIVAGKVPAKDLESRDFVAELGEPLQFGIDYPLPLLFEEGFRRVRTLTFDEACLELTGTYDRERAFRFQGLVMASRAALPDPERPNPSHIC